MNSASKVSEPLGEFTNHVESAGLLPGRGSFEHEFRLDKLKSKQAKIMCRDLLNEDFLKSYGSK